MPIDKEKLNDLSHYGASLTNLVQTINLLLDVPDNQQAEDCIRTVRDIAETFAALTHEIISEM